MGTKVSLSREARLWLAGIVCGAFVLRLALALLLPSLERPDEIFENLEPAFRMVTGAGVVTWEWREGIRSPMFPGFIAGLIALARAAELGAAAYLAAIAAVFSALSVATVAIGFVLGWRHSGKAGAIICGGLCAVWPDLVYFGPKPLGEVQAGNLLVIATFLAADLAASVLAPRRGMRAGLVGLLLGLVFCIRFQLAPVLLLIGIWAGYGDPRRRWLWMIAGGLPVLALMGLLDKLYWGVWFQSVWGNYIANVGMGISKEFGISPFYWYVTKQMMIWGPAIIPVGLGFMLGLRRAPLLGTVALLVVAEHSAVAHKEISFIYAALPPAIIVTGLGWAEASKWFGARVPAARRVLLPTTVALVVSLSLSTALGSGFLPNWTRAGGALKAAVVMREDPELCGLGIRSPDTYYWWTGGDVYLGRSVPIYAFATPAGAARVGPAVNYVIGGQGVADGLPGFSVLACWNDKSNTPTCLARAPQGSRCIADPSIELNSERRLGRVGAGNGAD